MTALMTPTSAIATRLLSDMQTALEANPSLTGKTLMSYGVDELIDKLKGLKPPAAGIVYEGMRSLPDPGVTNRQGLAAEAVIALILFTRPGTITSADTVTPAITILDEVRASLRGKRNSSGHLWKFVVEAPAVTNANWLIYVQRWSTPVLLT